MRIRVEPFDGELWWSTSAWSATTGATSSCASGAKIRTNAPAALGRWAERRWQPRDGPIRRSGPEAHRKGEGAGGGDRINVVGTMIRRSEGAFFLKLHGLWEWKRSGHRVPSGSPEGRAIARSTNCRAAASARPALRHRKTPRDRRRFGRRVVECSETDCRRQPEGQAKRSQPGARRGARRAGRANHTMEPIEVPPHAIWRDDFDESPLDRWADAEPIWDCHGAIPKQLSEA